MKFLTLTSSPKPTLQFLSWTHHSSPTTQKPQLLPPQGGSARTRLQSQFQTLCPLLPEHTPSCTARLSLWRSPWLITLRPHHSAQATRGEQRDQKEGLTKEGTNPGVQAAAAASLLLLSAFIPWLPVPGRSERNRANEKGSRDVRTPAEPPGTGLGRNPYCKLCLPCLQMGGR